MTNYDIILLLSKNFLISCISVFLVFLVWEEFTKKERPNVKATFILSLHISFYTLCITIRNYIYGGQFISPLIFFITAFYFMHRNNKDKKPTKSIIKETLLLTFCTFSILWIGDILIKPQFP